MSPGSDEFAAKTVPPVIKMKSTAIPAETNIFCLIKNILKYGDLLRYGLFIGRFFVSTYSIGLVFIKFSSTRRPSVFSSSVSVSFFIFLNISWSILFLFIFSYFLLFPSIFLFLCLCEPILHLPICRLWRRFPKHPTLQHIS